MIRYVHGGSEALTAVEPLWIFLRDHHVEKSQWFQREFARQTFEDRCNELKVKTGDDRLLVSLAFDENSSEPAGFGVSSIDETGVGELDWLHVLPHARKMGIAGDLIQAHLTWLHEHGAETIRLFVAEGNEEVMPLYHRYGFREYSFGMQLPLGWQTGQQDSVIADRSGLPELCLKRGSLELLPAIEPLWLALREHHIRTSPHFTHLFVEHDFEHEKLALMHAHRKGAVAINVVATASGILMGYCITARVANRTGLIESLYLRPDIRGVGAGVRLVQYSLEWLKAEGCEKVRVRVAVGNEEAMRVYEKAGFRLGTHLMQWTE